MDTLPWSCGQRRWSTFWTNPGEGRERDDTLHYDISDLWNARHQVKLGCKRIWIDTLFCRCYQEHNARARRLSVILPESVRTLTTVERSVLELDQTPICELCETAITNCGKSGLLHRNVSGHYFCAGLRSARIVRAVSRPDYGVHLPSVHWIFGTSSILQRSINKDGAGICGRPHDLEKVTKQNSNHVNMSYEFIEANKIL